MTKNYYQALGLGSNATKEEIKKAYRIYAAKFHPDKQGGDKFFEERFKEIQEAYEVLSDDSSRASYDLNFNQPSSYNTSKQSYRSNTQSYEDLKREREKQEREQRKTEQKEKETEQKLKCDTVFYTSKQVSVNGLYVNCKGEIYLLENYDSAMVATKGSISITYAIFCIVCGLLTVAGIWILGLIFIGGGVAGLFDRKKHYVVLLNRYKETTLIKGRKRKMKKVANKINQAIKVNQNKSV
jgi:DnaJ-domain-containing protein 1